MNDYNILIRASCGISCHLWFSMVTSEAEEVKKQTYEGEKNWVNWFIQR